MKCVLTGSWIAGGILMLASSLAPACAGAPVRAPGSSALLTNGLPDPESHGARDTYPDFATLAATESLGVDYSLTVVDRRSSITVMAIHGGKIEKGTSELAREVAQADCNLYLFEGIKPDHNFSLHITSRRFDEPQALGLMARSDYGISMHGFTEVDRPDAWIIRVGGDSQAFRSAFIDAASRAQLGVEIPAIEDRFPAPEPDNIVNRTMKAGLQLEMSVPLRKKILEDSGFRSRLALAVRAALTQVTQAP